MNQQEKQHSQKSKYFLQKRIMNDFSPTLVQYADDQTNSLRSSYNIFQGENQSKIENGVISLKNQTTTDKPYMILGQLKHFKIQYQNEKAMINRNNTHTENLQSSVSLNVSTNRKYVNATDQDITKQFINIQSQRQRQKALMRQQKLMIEAIKAQEKNEDKNINITQKQLRHFQKVAQEIGNKISQKISQQQSSETERINQLQPCFKLPETHQQRAIQNYQSQQNFWRSQNDFLSNKFERPYNKSVQSQIEKWRKRQEDQQTLEIVDKLQNNVTSLLWYQSLREKENTLTTSQTIKTPGFDYKKENVVEIIRNTSDNFFNKNASQALNDINQDQAAKTLNDKISIKSSRGLAFSRSHQLLSLKSEEAHDIDSLRIDRTFLEYKNQKMEKCVSLINKIKPKLTDNDIHSLKIEGKNKLELEQNAALNAFQEIDEKRNSEKKSGQNETLKEFFSRREKYYSHIKQAEQSQKYFGK